MTIGHDRYRSPLAPAGQCPRSIQCRTTCTCPDCGRDWRDLSRVTMKIPAGNPLTHPAEWARRCRIEAARAIHPSTKAFLLELAAQFESIAGQAVEVDPDDSDLQNAVADRLTELAARKRDWTR